MEEHRQRAGLSWPPPPPRPAAPSCRNCLHASTSTGNGASAALNTPHLRDVTEGNVAARGPRSESLFSLSKSISRLPKMVCCCLCCPIFKCAIWLCVLEIIVSLYYWYDAADHVVKTMPNIQLKDALVVVCMTSWLIALFTATGTLIAGHKRKNPTYLWPRLILQGGLLAFGVAGALTLFAYFSGAADNINSIIFFFYEKIFLDKPMTKDERKEANQELKFYAVGAILVDVFVVLYFALGFSVTYKFYKNMKREYAYIGPVSQHEPTAPPPPPPVNPAFAKHHV